MGALSRKAGDRTITASAVIVVVTKEVEDKSKDATILAWVDAREGIVVDGRTSFRMAINAAADRTEDVGGPDRGNRRGGREAKPYARPSEKWGAGANRAKSDTMDLRDTISEQM
jgi:hypothetical protein